MATPPPKRRKNHVRFSTVQYQEMERAIGCDRVPEEGLPLALSDRVLRRVTLGVDKAEELKEEWQEESRSRLLEQLAEQAVEAMAQGAAAGAGVDGDDAASEDSSDGAGPGFLFGSPTVDSDSVAQIVKDLDAALGDASPPRRPRRACQSEVPFALLDVDSSDLESEPDAGALDDGDDSDYDEDGFDLLGPMPLPPEARLKLLQEVCMPQAEVELATYELDSVRKHREHSVACECSGDVPPLSSFATVEDLKKELASRGALPLVLPRAKSPKAMKAALYRKLQISASKLCQKGCQCAADGGCCGSHCPCAASKCWNEHGTTVPNRATDVISYRHRVLKQIKKSGDLFSPGKGKRKPTGNVPSFFQRKPPKARAPKP